MIVRDFDRLITYSSTVQYTCTAVRYSTSDTVQHTAQYSRTTAVRYRYPTVQHKYVLDLVPTTALRYNTGTAIQP